MRNAGRPSLRLRKLAEVGAIMGQNCISIAVQFDTLCSAEDMSGRGGTTTARSARNRHRFLGSCIGRLRACWRRRARVLVVQSSQHRFRSHQSTRCPSTSGLGPRARRSFWRASCATQRAVRAQDPTPARLRRRDDPLQALPPDGADDPLGNHLRLRPRKR